MKQQARNEAFQAIAKSEFLFIGRYWPHLTHVSTCEPLSMLAGLCSAQSTRMPSPEYPAHQLCSISFCRAATTVRSDPLRTRVQLRVHHRRAHRAAVVRRRVHRRARYRRGRAQRTDGAVGHGRILKARQCNGTPERHALGVLDGPRWDPRVGWSQRVLEGSRARTAGSAPESVGLVTTGSTGVVLEG